MSAVKHQFELRNGGSGRAVSPRESLFHHLQATVNDPKRRRPPVQVTGTISPVGGATAKAATTLALIVASPGHTPCALQTIARSKASMLKNRPSNPLFSSLGGSCDAF